MKRNILIRMTAVILIIGMFIFTGCEKNGNGNQGTSADAVATVDGVKIKLDKERTLGNMKFKYPEIAKFQTEQENHLSMKIYSENDEKVLASVVLTVRTGKNVEEYIKTMRNVEASELQSETINGIKWYIYDFSGGDSISKVHYGQNGQDTYVVSFPQEGEAKNIDITDFKNTFMSRISFVK